MDAYSADAHSQIQPVRPHGIGADFEEEQQPEKKSVMRQMKDRVKKIKNTIRKKAHDYGHNSEEHTSNEGEEEEDDKDADEEEEEMEVDPEVHDAPLNEHAAAEKLVTGPTSHTHENGGPGSVSPVTSIRRAEEDPAAAPNSSTGMSAPSDLTQPISSSTGSDVVRESPISHSFQNMAISNEGQRRTEDENPPHVPEDKHKEPSHVHFQNMAISDEGQRLTEDENPPHITEDKSKEPSHVHETEKEALKLPFTVTHDNKFSPEKEKEALKSPPTGIHENKFSPENPPLLMEDELKEPIQADEKEKEALKSPTTVTQDNKFSPENPPRLTEDKPKEHSQVDEEKEAFKSPTIGSTHENNFSSDNPSRLDDTHDDNFSLENPPHLMEDKPKEPRQVDEKEKEALKSPPSVTDDNFFSPENPPRLTEDKPKESRQIDEKEKDTLESPPTVTHDNKFSPENPPRLTDDKPKEPSQVDEEEKETFKSPPADIHANNFSPENPLTEDKPKESRQVDEKENAPTDTDKLSSTATVPKKAAASEVVSDALPAKKEEAVESHTAEGEAVEAEGEGGIGMVGKFKGMVTSFLGAGS